MVDSERYKIMNVLCATAFYVGTRSTWGHKYKLLGFRQMATSMMTFFHVCITNYLK